MVDCRIQSRSGRAGGSSAVPTLLLLAVLAVLAAGCGDSSDTKANETYANGVCSAIGSWEQQVKSIATSFSGSVSKATLQSKIVQAKAATQDLTTQIKAVPAPDTSQGQAAKQQLNQLTTDINNTINAARSAVAQIPADASAVTVAATVTTLAPQVQNLASEAKSAVSALKSAGGSLASAFKSTDSCQNLGGS